MRTTITAFLAIAVMTATIAQGTPEQDRLWATRVTCELQTAGAQSLPTLTFSQGSTPLLSLDQYRAGKSVNADSNIVARLVFGPTQTNQYYVAVTNYAVSGNGYLIQCPTIGTNTTSGAWWYTAYFESITGHRYWTGNGRLSIISTTSTADGLSWQEFVGGDSITPDELTNTVNEAVSNLTAAIATQRVERVWSPDGTGYRDGTGGVWRIYDSGSATTQHVDTVELKSTQSGPRLDLIEAETNKWRQAYGWGDHALAGYLPSSAWQSWLSTNTYVRAETDAAALAALASFAATNKITRWYANPTNWLAFTGSGSVTEYAITNFSITFSGDFDPPVSVTGFPFVVPVEDYFLIGTFEENGEAIVYDSLGYRNWQSSSASFPQLLTPSAMADGTAVVSIPPPEFAIPVFAYNLTTGNVWQAVAEARQSAGQAADQIAGHLSDAAPHPGLFATASEVSGLKLGATNVTDGVTSGTYSEATRTFDISAITQRTVKLTNGTTMADGVYNTTNGVFFTKLGTNYWILLD